MWEYVQFQEFIYGMYVTEIWFGSARRTDSLPDIVFQDNSSTVAVDDIWLGSARRTPTHYQILHSR
jgi:hypothetical protein